MKILYGRYVTQDCSHADRPGTDRCYCASGNVSTAPSEQASKSSSGRKSKPYPVEETKPTQMSPVRMSARSKQPEDQPGSQKQSSIRAWRSSKASKPQSAGGMGVRQPVEHQKGADVKAGNISSGLSNGAKSEDKGKGNEPPQTPKYDILDKAPEKLRSGRPTVQQTILQTETEPKDSLESPSL